MKKQASEPELFTEIFFSVDNNSATVTVTCPDDNSELSIIVRQNGKKCTYALSIWEAEQMAVFIKEHVENHKKSN